MDKGWNKYFVRSLDLDKLERMMLYDARNEHHFSRSCIKEAIINAKTAQHQPTRAELETAEALEEDIL